MADLSRHFAAILDTDVRGFEEARAARLRAKLAEVKHRSDSLGPATKAGKALRRYVTRALAPHRAEWRQSTSHGFVMSWAPPRLSVSLNFELWPALQPRAPRFRTQARTPIQCSIMPRDHAELDHALAGIREAADRLALMLYSPSGSRAEEPTDD
jgi:hypothetical protein